MVLSKSTYLLQTGVFRYTPKPQSTRTSTRAWTDTAPNQPTQWSAWVDGRTLPSCYHGNAYQLFGTKKLDGKMRHLYTERYTCTYWHEIIVKHFTTNHCILMLQKWHWSQWIIVPIHCAVGYHIVDVDWLIIVFGLSPNFSIYLWFMLIFETGTVSDSLRVCELPQLAKNCSYQQHCGPRWERLYHIRLMFLPMLIILLMWSWTLYVKHSNKFIAVFKSYIIMYPWSIICKSPRTEIWHLAARRHNRLLTHLVNRWHHLLLCFVCKQIMIL